MFTVLRCTAMGVFVGSVICLVVALLSLAPESWPFLSLVTAPISGGIGLVFGLIEAIRRRKSRGEGP
jgi:hypothetical protein